jgi:hypothetical protein
MTRMRTSKGSSSTSNQHKNNTHRTVRLESFGAALSLSKDSQCPAKLSKNGPDISKRVVWRTGIPRCTTAANTQNKTHLKNLFCGKMSLCFGCLVRERPRRARSGPPYNLGLALGLRGAEGGRTGGAESRSSRGAPQPAALRQEALRQLLVGLGGGGLRRLQQQAALPVAVVPAVPGDLWAEADAVLVRGRRAIAAGESVIKRPPPSARAKSQI